MAAGVALNGGAAMWDDLMPSDAFEILGKVLNAATAAAAVLTVAVLNAAGTANLMKRHTCLEPMFAPAMPPPPPLMDDDDDEGDDDADDDEGPMTTRK
eukprot:2740322-Prymnesium_polylepis.1